MKNINGPLKDLYRSQIEEYQKEKAQALSAGGQGDSFEQIKPGA